MIIVFIAEPFKINNKDELELPNEFFGFSRISLQVGHETTCDIFKPDAIIREVKQKKFNLSGLVLSKFSDARSEEGLPLYIYDTVYRGDQLTFFGHLGNTDDKDLNFTIIPILGLKQTDAIIEGLKSDNFHGTIKSNTQGLLKINLTAADSGSSNLLFILIKNPGVSFRNYKSQPFDFGVESTPKLSLVSR